ncbi:hypothetical protein DVH05_022928 [Phytophthora capsici]|nr:hypothetical protein DVH05_022928 [Phytophthora capsici]
MAFPFTTGADYYRADDEKDEYEVDNSFDYTPEEETSDLQQPNKLMTTTSQTTATAIEQQTSLTLPPSFEEEQLTSDNGQGTTETSGEEGEEKGGSLDEGEDDEDKQLKSPAPVAAKMTDDMVPVHLNLSTVAPLPLRDDPAHAVKNVFPHVNVDDGEGIVSETSSSEIEEAAEQTEKAAQVASSTPLMPAAATITSSPKPIQVNTPVTLKKVKRAASKKRKTPPTRGKSGGNRSVKERRSSRTQHEPPRSTCAVSFAAEMSHFNLLPCYISCDHCGKKLKDSLGNATRHLKSCPVLRNQQLVAAQKEEEAVQNDVELPIPAATPVNSGMTLVQLMGTEALAAKVPGAFASTPFAGDAPLDRFDSVLQNDVTGLRHLVVVDLLEAVNVSDGPILQLQTTVPSRERRTGHDQLTPLSKAKARALEGKSLRFPAPHTVAEQFITPLAQELGLEYAMQQHRVNIVSCPQDDVGLDWRFRQTETVVFQLRGEATWKLKRGKVDYPLCNFEPQTWLMEEMAQLAKVHGLAAGGTGTKGFLLSPREELSVFNVDGSGENEVLEHLLRAGSVAYVPAGVWFYSTTHGKNTLWLEVELSSMTYETLALSALKHLACGDKQAPKRLQIHRGNRDQIKTTRCHLQTQILSLRSKMIELEGADLLPEYLCTDDLQELISRGLIRVLSKSPGSPLSIEVDLTNPKFKLKHEKVYKDARYRVNPIALLLREDEIPHRSVNEGSRDGLWSSLTEKHLALKKRPKPPPKCTKAPRQRYNFDLPVGSQDCKLLLHVCCQCSLEQSKFVEWIRSRGEKSFGLEELARRGDLSKSSGRTEETARNVLRFLHFVGYVTLGRFP